MENRAAAVLTAFGSQVAASPAAHTHMIDGLQRASAPSTEIVIDGRADSDETCAFLDVVREHAPDLASVLIIEPGEKGDPLRRLAPFTANFEAEDGRITAYLCRDHRCGLPTTDPAALANRLRGSD